MKLLFLGGTTFFGRRLVQLLLGGGHDTTIATRVHLFEDCKRSFYNIKKLKMLSEGLDKLRGLYMSFAKEMSQFEK